MVSPFYSERLQSNLTTGLFLLLALFGWQVNRMGWRFTTVLFLFLGLFFLFCVFNYRSLQIQIFERELVLKFGLVRWKVEFDNIYSCGLDDLPWWIKYGGAGVHFAFVEGIYRAFLNFLEGPRILILFDHKQGLVKGLSFSTRQPDQILELLRRRIAH